MTKKAVNAVDRQMGRTKKTRSKHHATLQGKTNPNKQFLLNTVVGIIGFIVVSGAIAFFSSSQNIHNLATVMPHGSTLMMEQMGGRSFSPPDLKSATHFPGNHPQIQIPTPGGSGTIFADARHTDTSRQQRQRERKEGSARTRNDKNNVISLDSDFQVNPVPTSSDVRQNMNKFSDYKYYYYDSNSQAFHLHDQFTTYPTKPTNVPSSTFQASLSLPGRYQPTLCSDGRTIGFSDLSTLRNAIGELNDAYNLAVSRWEHYNSALSEYKIIKFNHQHGTSADMVDIEAPPALPEHLLDILKTVPDPFVICPHTTLRTSLGRNSPIFIDAEDVVVECDTCVLDTPGTHFSFGSYAKNVIVKGLTMMGATESSIILRYNGAEVIFEDCYWVNNDSVKGMHGSVADMNSTSTVQFFRCEISDVKQSSRTGIYGPKHVSSSSLTLRG